jgi:hypothetical protein
MGATIWRYEQGRITAVAFIRNTSGNRRPIRYGWEA